MTARIQTTLFGGIAAALASIFLPAATSANPDGGEVIAGDVTINGGPGRLDVSQAGDKAIIQWQSFDVATGEQTYFQQPSVDSVTLNRVVTGGASRIDGLVTAPGKVFVVNPSGMIFGPNAQVAVNSLVATTSDLANEDFLAGRYEFSLPSRDPDATVVNRGAIEAAAGGAIVLAAPDVRNEGVVVASLGTVELAGTDRFVLDFAGDGLLSFDIGPAGPDALPSEGRDRVVQQGRVEADGGMVVLSARAADALVDRAINMTGVIEARSVGQQDGAIILSGGAGTVGIEGTLDVSGVNPGESAGHVEISGARVGLFDGARILADGQNGGGTVHVGSHAPAYAPSAGTRRSYVGADAVVVADATGNGDGGQVVVWAEETTRFYGAVSARGAGAGDGGFVEVSARGGLTFDGTADVGAGAGAAGNVLLDPENIFICAPPTCSRVVTGDVFADQDPGLDYFVNSQALGSLTGNITLQARNDISIASPINLVNMRAGASLALQAGNDVSIQGGASISTAGGDLILEADSPRLAADGNGNLSFAFDPTTGLRAALNTNGGDITLVAADFNLFPVVVDAGAGDIHVATSLPGRVVSMNELNSLAGLQTLGTLTVSAGGVSTDNAGISSAAAATVIETTGNILLFALPDPLITNGGSLSLRGQTVLLNQVNTFGGDFDVIADTFAASTVDVGAGDVSVRAGLFGFGGLSNQGTLTLEPSSPTTPIAIGALANPVPGAFLVSGALLSNQVGFGQLVVGRIDGAHPIEIGDIAFPLEAVAIRSPAGGGIEVTGDVIVGSSLSLAAPNVSVSTGSITVRGALDVSATGDVIGTGPVAVAAGNSRFAAGGTIALTNPANAFAGPVSLVASGGDVTVVTQGQLSLGASSLGPGQVLLFVGDLAVAGPITGTGDLILRPFGVNDNVGIGGVNAAFSLSDAELESFSDAFASITVGGPNQIGELLVAGAQVATPLTLQVDPAAGSISVLGDLTGIDDAAFTFSGPVRLGANIVTDEGSIRFLSPVTLAGDVSIRAGSLSLGLLSGQGTLTLEPSSPTTPIAIGAGASPAAGAFVIGGNLLSGPPGFGQLVVGRIDGAHPIEIGDIAFPLEAVAIRSPAGGGIEVTGDVIVGSSLSLAAPNVSVSTGSITVRGALDVSATGDVIGTGPVAVAAGNSRFAAGGTIALTNPANAFAGPVSLVASGGDVTVVTQGQLSLGASSLGPGQVLLFVGDLAVAGPITGTGDLILRPFGVNDNVGIGGVNAAFSLSDAELESFSDAFASITVGGPNQIGELLVAGAQVAMPLTLQVDPAAGAISVLGDLTGIADAAFTFSGPVRLGANITTDGGSIRFLSPVTLAGDVRLDAAGAGNIVFAGPLDGAANILTVGGGFVSNDLSIPLTLGGLVIEESAGGANLVGSVDRAAGRAAAVRVQLRGGVDANYVINGCVMGVDCEQLPNPTLLSIPAVPLAAETVRRAAANTLAVWERLGQSPDPRDAVYSNLGNEELWPAEQREEDE